MYFENRESALREMMRVLQPGGSLTIAVWDKFENNPGLAAEGQLWQQVFGPEWADDVPYGLGDKGALKSLLDRSAIPNFDISTQEGTARFSSTKNWLHTGAKGWTEDDAISDEQLDLLLQMGAKELTNLKTADGKVSFPTSVHIVTARK